MDINHVSRFLLGVHEDTQTRANTSFDSGYNAGLLGFGRRLRVSGLTTEYRSHTLTGEATHNGPSDNCARRARVSGAPGRAVGPNGKRTLSAVRRVPRPIRSSAQVHPAAPVPTDLPQPPPNAHGPSRRTSVAGAATSTRRPTPTPSAQAGDGTVRAVVCGAVRCGPAVLIDRKG